MTSSFADEKKGKLAVISDFHLDSNHFSDVEYQILHELLQEKGITDLHFAGDLSNDFHDLTASFFEKFSQHYKLTYNLGNHDMMNMTEKEIESHDFIRKQLGDKVLIAFHGWYDYDFFTGDSSDILQFKNNFYFDRKINRASDDRLTTEQTLVRLESLLAKESQELILVMHFVPNQEFIFKTRYKKLARFNAFLGSPKFHELFKNYPNIKTVIFGHIHRRFPKKEIDGISYHARPLGYSYEWEMLQDFFREFPDLKTSNSLQPRKQYNPIKNLPEWEDFRMKNLKKEFESAMTIIDFQK